MITSLRTGAVRVDLDSPKQNRVCIEHLGGYKLVGVVLPQGRKSDTETLKLINNSEALNAAVRLPRSHRRPHCHDLKVRQ